MDTRKHGASDCTCHRRFAAYYNRSANSKNSRRFMDPLRAELAGKAQGLVLEIGAGTGQNFPFYPPGQIERVEAIEPDSAMLAYAQTNIHTAQIPVTLTQASVELLPFPDALFDTVLATLVFCSVSDPQHGFSEIKRVLKPGGTLLLIEHVRSKVAPLALLQDLVTPITKRTLGNCHWNRDTISLLQSLGIELLELRNLGGFVVPMVLIVARFR